MLNEFLKNLLSLKDLCLFFNLINVSILIQKENNNQVQQHCEQRSQQDRKGIFSSTNKRNSSTDDSLEGSPLKMEKFDMDCPFVKDLDSNMGSALFRNSSNKHKIPGSPVDVRHAR